MRTRMYSHKNIEENIEHLYVNGIRNFTYSNASNILDELERYETVASYLSDKENKGRLNKENDRYSNQIASRLVDIWIDKTLPKEIRDKSNKILETIFQNCLSCRE